MCNIQQRKSLFFLLFFVITVLACKKIPVYEKTKPFANYQWFSKDSIAIQFEIIDTLNPYQFFFVLRHQNAYPYRNIWTKINIETPDSSFTLKRDFMLADATHWLGTSMDDIIEQRIVFNEMPAYLKKGNYRFTIQQIMRDNPLPNIIQAGIRVEKINP